MMKTLFLNPKLVAANDVHAYFTVNSVFFDPDIFGRFRRLLRDGQRGDLLPGLHELLHSVLPGAGLQAQPPATSHLGLGAP